MLSSKFVRPAGFVVGAGTALTAFGLAAPAQAVVDCADGVTVDATELAIRVAIGDGETLICVNPGTIDMSSNGVDSDSTPLNVDDQDLHLVALGDVTFDGGDDADFALIAFGATDENLTIDGFTFTNFNNNGNTTLPTVMLDGSAGTLTVINSTFTNNNGYAVVGASDFDDTGLLPDIVIENSYFEGNSVGLGTVWGYGNIAVSNSTFIGEENSWGVINGNDQDGTKSTILHGNYFEDNSASDAVVSLTGDSNSVYNNTFLNNYSSSSDDGSVITFNNDAGGSVAFNTFAGNDSDYDNANIELSESNDVVLHGNVFDVLEGELAISGTNTTVTDGGGNVTTSDEGYYFGDDTSVIEATSDEIDLQDPADNGGSTLTMTLGEDSIARDVLESSLVANELGPDLDWDQRGEARGDLVDAGAWDDGESSLASTGVDAAGIALTGGLIGAAGAALVVRRRRKA